MEGGAPDPDPTGGELVAGPGDHPIRLGVGAEHVERLARAHPEAAALTDCEVVVAAVRAEGASRAIHDLPGSVFETGVAAQKLAFALSGEEAEVLALGPARHLEPG